MADALEAAVRQAIELQQHTTGAVHTRCVEMALSAERELLRYAVERGIHRRDSDEWNTRPFAAEFRLEFIGPNTADAWDNPANFRLMRFHVLDERPRHVSTEPTYFLHRLPAIRKRVGL